MIRRRVGWWAAIALFLALMLLGAACGGGAQPTGRGTERQAPASQSSGKTGADAEQPRETGEQSKGTNNASKRDSAGFLKVAVTRIVDGDTIYVRLEDGHEEKVRFIGVDTPESTREVEPYGREAAAYTKERLSGKTVYLELDVAERDKYGRLLAYVWMERPKGGAGAEMEVWEKMFNAELLLAGMAQVMTVPPNVKYADLFVEFQREAREEGRGLWGETGPPATAGQSNAEAKYIGNANSKKFHRPDCEWAAKIASGNRVELASRQEAIDGGYEPCKVCDP